MSIKTNRPHSFHDLRTLLCMAKAQTTGRTQKGTAFHRQKDRTFGTESDGSPEDGGRGDEINRPPARVLPAEGTQSARQPYPQVDSPGELYDVVLLVPKSVARSRPRCCHRPSQDPDADCDTHCNQDGEYDEWSLAEIETHRQVRRCEICFPTGFADTLTPSGDYAPDTRVRTCPTCNERISGWQYGAHKQVCMMIDGSPKAKP